MIPEWDSMKKIATHLAKIAQSDDSDLFPKQFSLMHNHR